MYCHTPGLASVLVALLHHNSQSHHPLADESEDRTVLLEEEHTDQGELDEEEAKDLAFCLNQEQQCPRVYVDDVAHLEV